MIALALAAWLWSVTRNLAARGRGIGALVALLVLAGSLYGVSLLQWRSGGAAAGRDKGRALQRRQACRLSRPEPARVRGRNRCLVHHLPGE